MLVRMEPPYRTPAPDDEREPDEDPPGSYRRRSWRVLGALARLTGARGAFEASHDLSSRAASSRPIDDAPRPRARCVPGNQALADGDHAFAEIAYGLWLASARESNAASTERVEVLAGLAAVANAREDRELAGAHLFEAVRCGPIGLAGGAPVAAILALASTWLRLGALEHARKLLIDARANAEDRSRAAVDLAIAEYALARGDGASASAAVDRALDGDLRDAERVAAHVAQGRARHLGGDLADAEQALLCALELAHTAHPRPSVAEAEAMAHLALVQHDQGRVRDALSAQRVARAIADRAVPSAWAVHVPILRSSRTLLRAAGDPEARHVEARLATIVASHRSDDTLR